jgi:hypothetical protein
MSDQLVAEAANYTTNTREQYPCPSLLGWPKCIGTGEGLNPLINSFNIHASAGFEPAIPSIERPQTYALDSMASGIGHDIVFG